MAKNDNLKDFLTDVANAIREKKGTTDLINPQDFSAEIASIQSGGGSKWTGHADAEGLRAIGWTDEDIAYYQENGVNWNEEDDDYHKVTDDNKALYGVLTADNISTYKNRIVYLPKIDTSAKTHMAKMFSDCYSLVAIPKIDTSNAGNVGGMFENCHSLVAIPLLDTSNAFTMSSMFKSCYSLVTIPLLDTSKVTNMAYMFDSCYSLVTIPLLDTSKVTNMSYMFYYCRALVTIPLLDTSNVTNMGFIFDYCNSLAFIPLLDTSKVTNMSYIFRYNYVLASILLLDMGNISNASNMFDQCYSLYRANFKNVKASISLSASAILSKESLLYIINNEAATSAITITLKNSAYTRLSEDADIVAALANHPNISLASA